MDWLWFAGGAVIGWILMGWITIQIGISLFCALPALRKLEGYEDCFYLGKCKGAFIRTIIINSIITAAAFAAVIVWAPWYMMIGFFVGFGGTLLLSIGQMGMTENNLRDMLRILDRYVVPGKDDEAFLAITNRLFR